MSFVRITPPVNFTTNFSARAIVTLVTASARATGEATPQPDIESTNIDSPAVTAAPAATATSPVKQASKQTVTVTVEL